MEIALRDDYDALYKTLCIFVEGVLIYNSVEMISEVLADDVIGMGMGEQGAYFSKVGFRQLYLGLLKNEAPKTNAYIEYGNIDIRIFSPECASINAEVHLKSIMNEKTVTTSILQMASARKAHGKWLWFMVSVMPLVISGDSIHAYPLTFADNILAALKAELQADTFDLVNKNFSGGILGTYIDENYPLYYANDILITMLGYEREEFEIKFKDSTTKLNHESETVFMHEATQSGTEGNKTFGAQAKWVKKDGSTIYVEFRSRKAKDNYGNDVLLSVVWDVSELVGKTQYDALTCIYNRHYLDKTLNRIICSLMLSNGTLSVMMADIDYFKQYNDTYGHDMGDECLKAIANALCESLNRSDDFVARYGGEEFIVILPGISEHGACVIAERILNKIISLSIPHEKSLVADCVTISIGVTIGKVTSIHTGRDFIKHADEALYKSKKNGRNRYTFCRL